MKKRILSALMAIMLCVVSIGAVSVSAETGDLILSDTTTVNVENTDTCFAKATDEEYHADSNYYMHFKAGAQDWLEVAQNLTEGVTAGNIYTLTVVAKPVLGTVWFRVGWDDTGWLTSGQVDLATDLGDGWFKYVKEITMTAEQTNVLFHNDGAAEIYVDSISLKPVGEEKELLPNSGFDAIVYDAETGATTASATTVNLENTDTCFAKMIGVELPAENEYSLHFKATAADWLEVSQNLTATAEAGKQYVFTAYVKPVSGTVWFYIDWDTTGWMATHAADVIAPQPDGWTMIQRTITMTEGKSKMLFHNDGATEFYIDDISLVEVDGTENLIPDGGFDEVTVEGSTEPDEPAVDIPDEDLTLSSTTRVSANADNCYAKVTDNEKNSGSYSLHFYTEGDWIEIAQDYTEALSAGTYTLTWYAKGTGKVWFYSNWGTEFAATHSVDSAVEQSNGWTKYTRTLAIDGEGDTSFLFHNDGTVDCYIDDISLVDENGVNYIIDGGFEEVTVAGEEPTPTPTPTPDEPAVDIPDENLTLSDKTHLNQENTDTCFAKVTDNEKASGSYSLHFKATAADWLEVDQTITETATTGNKYILSASVKVVSGKVWFRVDWDDTGWLVSNQTDLGTDIGDGWIKLTKEITMTGDGAKVLFHNDGEAEMYIDDISLKAVGSDTELVPDGGFEEVTVAGSTEPDEPAVDIPDEDLTLSSTTRVSANADNCYAKVTDNEKNSGSYSLHFYTEGDWIEIAQDYTEALAAGTYTLTWYAKGTGTVWFYSNWGTEFAATHSVDSAVEQSNGWTKYTRTLAIDGDGDTSFLFHGDGAVDCYIDDVSLVDANGVNYIIDGGFEEVTVAGSTEPDVPAVDIPDEDLVLSSKTTVNVENTDTCFAKVTDNEKNEGSYSLHFKAPATDWLEVSQKLAQTLKAGEKYIISVHAKVVSGRIWFRLGWDDDAWMIAENVTRAAAGWTKFEKEVTIKGNAGDIDTFLFHNAQDMGDAEFYIDSISVKAVDSDTELLSDGGFEDVKLICEGEHTWDEGVVALEPTVEAEGIKVFTCTACGLTRKEAIDKLPSFKAGDANGDELIDVKDVITIRRHIAGGYTITIVEEAANVNGDAIIDVKDAITIRRFIAGGYGVEL